jgi:hypothetical protein
LPIFPQSFPPSLEKTRSHLVVSGSPTAIAFRSVTVESRLISGLVGVPFAVAAMIRIKVASARADAFFMPSENSGYFFSQ